MFPYSAIRARPGLFQQDGYGYGLNDTLVPRRGLSGRTSPVGLAGRFGVGGGLGGGLHVGLPGVGGLGGIPLAGLNGLNGIGGLNGGMGINQLALNGVGSLQGYGGGLAGRGRLSPFLAGSAPLPSGNAILPRSAGFSPNTISTLGRGRNRGLLGGNNENHYVYPPASELFTLPVCVNPNSGRRGNNILNRLGGLGGEASEFFLTVPFSATVSDIFDELNKGRLDYNLAAVYVLTQYGELHSLEQLLGYDAMALWEIEPACIIIES